MTMEDGLKESIYEHIRLIKNLSSLSNVQAIVFVNILSIDNPEMFNKLKEITEWECKVLSEFMQNTKENEKRVSQGRK